MSNHSIPSMHAERKITVHSHKHSFTPYLSLSPYSPTDRMTDGGTNTLAVRGLEELRVNLLLKDNSYVGYITLHWSLLLKFKFYKLYMFWYVLCLVALLKGRYYTNYFMNYYYSNNSWSIKIFSATVCSVILFSFSIWLDAASNIRFVRSKHQHYST